MGHSSILNIIRTIILPCAGVIVPCVGLVLSNKKTPEAIIEDFRFPDFYDNPDGMDYTEENLKKCKKLTSKYKKKENYYKDLLEKVSDTIEGKFLNNIATCYFYNNEKGKAEDYYLKAIKKLSPEDKKYRSINCCKLANIYLDKDIKKAENHFFYALDKILEYEDNIEFKEINKELLEKLKEIINEDIVKKFPETTTILCTLGLIYEKKGLFKEAFDSFDMASMFEQKVFQENIKRFYRSKDHILSLYADNVDKDEMLPMLDKKEEDVINEGVELLKQKEEVMNEPCEVIISSTNLGILLVKLKRYKKGREYLKKALELIQINDKWIHQNEKAAISCLSWVAESYRRENNTEKYSETKIMHSFLELFYKNTFAFKFVLLLHNKNTFYM